MPNFTLQSSLLMIATVLAGGCAVPDPATPLAAAAHRGDAAVVRQLAMQGADVNAFGPDGFTALHWAARGGHPLGPHRCEVEAPGRLLVVATLLELGADPDLVDRRLVLPFRASGWTPLFTALRHEQFKTATLLLERGADPNIPSRRGKTVLATAADEGAPKDLLQLILARGFDTQLARRPR
jgi:ankyrin repeat protein